MNARHPRFLPIIVLVICAASVMSGQSIAETAPEGRLRPYVAWSPPKLLEPVNRGLLGAVGLVWPAGWSAEVGYLWLLPQDEPTVNVSDQRGGRLHLTGRRYFVQRPETPLVPFVQVRGDLLWRTHRTVATFQEETETGEFILHDDSVGVDTRTRTLNLMVGADWAITAHLAVEFSAGVGTRFRRVRHVDSAYGSDTEYRLFLEDAWDSRNNVGEFTTFNLPFDLRLIYRW
ncbi:hypothetical protein [Lewinella sp. IMCC34183]|uniref:hypothetical protein n=1 Tax=Lewinella sp. IMCC34183 TaxID=2248762 RepID=UPI000E250911|nr:hypothetical protein [Lewinella sp. IMCC34183]